MKDIHDKEWILDGRTIPLDELNNERTYAYTKNKYDYHILIPQSLLDQIRRDAKKEAYVELLDELEKKELDEAINSQNIYKLKGKGNVCPKCQKVGEFGSISRYTSIQKKEYYLCSWCNTISKVAQ